jgi:CheY-like chemotaxis protein
MPVVDGFAILSWLRANLPDVKMIVLSFSESTTDQDRAAELGAVAQEWQFQHDHGSVATGDGTREAADCNS